MGSYFEKSIFCYCHIGGKIITCVDKSVRYEGGLINGFPIDQHVVFDQFVRKVHEILEVLDNTLTLKYSVQADKTRLLPLNGQDALKNLLRFNEGIADVYAFEECNMTTVRHQNIRNSTSQAPTTNVIGMSSSIDPVTPLVSDLWKSLIKEEGQIFDGIFNVRDVLHKFALANRFMFKYVKNDTSYIRAKCAVVTCPWKVSIGQVGYSGIYIVKKFVREHIHSAQDQIEMKTLVPARFVGSIVKEKIKKNPAYLPMQIVSDFSTDYSLNISYKKAWRGKEKAKEAVDGVMKDSYKLLPWMCERLESSNPGTVAIYTSDDEQRFHQLFIAYYASLHGFRIGCRPLLFIDGTFLKGPFHGYMLGATALDANDGMYPVAFGIVKSESLENWLWFLENLKAALNEDREIIIISDRSQSIISAVRQVYSDGIHAHCFRHLKENFLKFLGKFHLSKATKGTLEDHLDIIAYTFQVKAYDRALDRMKRLCVEAYDWVIESEPKHWANSQFPKKRYGKLYSNVAESFNGWVLKERELPIMGIIEKTREKLTKYIYKRKNKAILWKLLVGKRIDEILALNVKLGERMQIMSCSIHMFEVHEIHGNFGVDLERKSCGCGKWEATGLPCEHGCAAIIKANLNVYDFVEECYHKETQRRIYSETMRPVPTHDMPSLDFFEDETDDDGYIDELSEPDKLLPPRCKKPPGRPRRKRIESQHIERREFHCSRCNTVGHNRKTCKQPIIG